MNALLHTSQRLRTEFSDRTVIVDKLLGEGAQGKVYAADMGGELVAAKWYRPEAISTKLRDRLRRLRESTTPSPKFLWPIDILISSEVSGFGYVMPFREKRFHELGEVVSGAAPVSFRSSTVAGLEFAETFKALHASGCCYHDINDGNLAFDTLSGEVRICDTDNVDKNGIAADVLGTPGFMAPELVQGLAPFPTSSTDQWSLAVGLFKTFIGVHPLLGRRESEHQLMSKKEYEELLRKLCGAEALFVFDPYDPSNALEPGYHDAALLRWPICPQFLRNLFTQAFTVGIRNSSQRIFEGQWVEAMARLRDSIMFCARCGAENFYEPGVQRACWNCRQTLSPGGCIDLPGYTIVVSEDATVFRYHLDAKKPPSSSSPPIGRVVRPAEHPNVIALKNVGDMPWRVTLPEGKEGQVDPNRHVRLRPGVRIAFGTVEGIVS